MHGTGLGKGFGDAWRKPPRPILERGGRGGRADEGGRRQRRSESDFKSRRRSSLVRTGLHQPMPQSFCSFGLRHVRPRAPLQVLNARRFYASLGGLWPQPTARPPPPQVIGTARHPCPAAFASASFFGPEGSMAFCRHGFQGVSLLHWPVLLLLRLASLQHGANLHSRSCQSA
jgi:hypothetical protein